MTSVVNILIEIFKYTDVGNNYSEIVSKFYK